jgi:hypothetical protein
LARHRVGRQSSAVGGEGNHRMAPRPASNSAPVEGCRNIAGSATPMSSSCASCCAARPTHDAAHVRQDRHVLLRVMLGILHSRSTPGDDAERMAGKAAAARECERLRTAPSDNQSRAK